MKSKLILTIVVAALAGCQPSSSPSGEATPSTATPVSAPGTTQTQVKFEVRDFKLAEKIETYGITAKGRGTLVTKDDSLKKGSYMVWLSVKWTQGNDEPEEKSVILRDGIGTIETYAFIPSEDRAKKKVKYFDWKVLGFVKLQEGVIVLDEPVAAKQLANE